MMEKTSSSKRPRVVVLGGGYAGLSCLIELSKKNPSAELHLVDARAEHCKLTNLHKAFRLPLSRFSIPYEELASRFRFNFHRHRVLFGPADLVQWQINKAINLGRKSLGFDYLVICTGAMEMHLPGGKQVFCQEDLRRGKGPCIIENFLACHPKEGAQVTVVGGGGTGIQMLFELRELLTGQKVKHGLRLVDLFSHLTPDQPSAFHRYIVRQLRSSGIEYLPETKYLGQSGGRIRLQCLSTAESYTARSDLTLLFPGVVPAPAVFSANGSGQIILDDELLPDLFCGGDCSRFESRGLNRLTAQAAVRKGKIVAQNIQNLQVGKPLKEYRYREQGYVISLGRKDAIGWVGFNCNIVSGLPASGIKRALELQYDLYIQGLDTYMSFLPEF